MNAPVIGQVTAVTSDGPAAARKPTLMLHYDEDHIGLEKRLLFEAASPERARYRRRRSGWPLRAAVRRRRAALQPAQGR